ncbi:MAG: hypothetical protein ACFFDC_15895 [Promethearchaeota archaeon]
MDEKTIILLIRTIYWIGVVLDALFALDMMVIALFAVMTPLSSIYTLPELIGIGFPYQFALGIASTMMWGWTALLIWGVQKPLERKGILLLTAFPVITGLMISNILAGLNGLISSSSLIIRPGVYLGLLVMFASGYFLADNLLDYD